MQAERPEEKEIQSSDVNSIQHIVSKTDTPAGVAIKYGVEVADIKRLNGLVTDHQMFALRSLQIPQPGRHPPSPVAVNSPASNRMHSDALDSFISPRCKSPRLRVTPAMSSLQDYYGLAPPNKDTEMGALYRSESTKELSSCNPGHRRARSLAIDRDRNGEGKKSGGAKAVRRRQKADADLFPSASEPEYVDRAMMDRDVNCFVGAAAPMKGTARIDALSAVRKSSSTSNLQETAGSNNRSIRRSSTRCLKADGFPRPANVWRSKAAID